jgi:hypothetical protein
VIKTCARQLRTGFARAYALDFGAVLSMAEAMGAPLWMVAELLPDVESALIAAMTKSSDTDGGDE